MIEIPFYRSGLILSVPFSSGQGMLRHSGIYPSAQMFLSVPFSSGQGMLLARCIPGRQFLCFFQSPFHRVKECYISIF